MKKLTSKTLTPPPPSCDAIVKLNCHEIAIDALVSGSTVTDAARMAGIRRETLSRWLHGNPVFIAKLNEKKNEARHEGIACINSIVVQSVTALGGALRHPDINPTAVVQSIMSMLPKMYAIMLEQGDAETASRNIMLNLLCKQSMAQDALYFDNPEEAEVMLKQYIDAHEAEMEYEQAVDREGVPQELVEHLHDKLNKVVEKLKPVVGKRK